ncbi:MAG TPA: helix-turn-helix domain-containing protein [Catalimonadaceae bacterium]|nr:helix-turn-helix domain-containing protein [Catalimonadaceae bacterium]
MKHLTLLVPNGENNLSSIVGAYKILSRANSLWQERGKDPVFQIQLAGLQTEVDFYDGLFSVKPHTHVSAISRTDLILIPSLNHNFELAIRENTEMIDWIRSQYRLGAELASICTGAFFLAETGILNGKSCSTHWSAADVFRSRFTEVRLQPDRLITDENGIYTNGGAYSFLQLMLYLVEKYFDRETAILCSKIFQIDMDRQSQSSFIIFSGQKKHNDELVKKVQDYLESNVQEKWSVEELSSRFALGRRTFDRRFSKATGNSLIEYAQRVKIEAAKKALESTRKTVQEIMYDVGYSDLKAFREVFRKVTGVSPVEYKMKWGRELGIRG